MDRQIERKKVEEARKSRNQFVKANDDDNDDDDDDI